MLRTKGRIKRAKTLRVSLNELKSDPSEIAINSWAAFRMAALYDQHKAVKEKMLRIKQERKAFEDRDINDSLTDSSTYLINIPQDELTNLEQLDQSLEKRQLEPKSSIVSGPVISFHDLTYEILIRKGFCNRHRYKKTILNNVSGLLLPGMNALMGPTGCGKTTLLDILAGRKDMSQVKGTILVNGYKQPAYFKCMAGYVVQDDVLLGTLTVRESVMFSANLRLPSDVSMEDKKAKVTKVISDLGLNKCADTKVGTEFIRGVSGGERKRTCIAMELIVSPSILFLDEPTTGLDASTANSVMSLLHNLSRQGLTIIFSIHQPRYGIFKKFDGLILLASGIIIYHGPSAGALDFFQQQNYTCEPHNNPPDFFLDVINGEVHAVSTPQLNGHAEVELTDLETLGDRKTKIMEQLSLNFKGTFWFKRIQKTLDRKLKIYLANPKTITHQAKYATSMRTQLRHVSRRSLINVYRNPAASLSQIVMTLFFAFAVSVFFYGLDNGYPEAVQNRAGAFFFIIMICLFGNMSAVEVFLKERVIFIHEMHSGFYRVSVFFFSKIFCDLIPLRIIPMFIFAAITYWMIGLAKDSVKFGIYFFTLFLTTLVAAILTFVISAGVRVLALANIYVGLVYTLMMLFAGLLVNLKTMSTYISWLEYLSIVRYSIKVLSINEMEDAIYYIYDSNRSRIIQNMTSAGNDYLLNQGIKHDTSWDFWQNHVALGIMAFFLTILCYIELRVIVHIK